MSLPIPVEFIQPVLQEVEVMEHRLHKLLQRPVRVRLELDKNELDEMVLQTIICKVCGVTWRDIAGSSRKTKYLMPRHLYCYAAKLFLMKTDKAIAVDINRDRTTVYHSVAAIADLLEVRDRIATEFWIAIKAEVHQLSVNNKSHDDTKA